MEKLLNKDDMFCLDDDCKKILDILKENMVMRPILVFLDWKKELHVHVDASCIALGVVLTQPREYDFEVIVKPERLNVGPDHLSQIKNAKEPTNLDEGLLDMQLFHVRVTNENFEDIIHFLSTGIVLEGYTTQQKKELVVRAASVSMIVGHLYKMGSDEVLCRYVPEYERHSILAEAHGGVVEGHYASNVTT
eukprot:PITA_23757